jgi:hypothetical protein
LRMAIRKQLIQKIRGIRNRARYFLYLSQCFMDIFRIRNTE